jgi:hypothetical protein
MMPGGGEEADDDDDDYDDNGSRPMIGFHISGMTYICSG